MTENEEELELEGADSLNTESNEEIYPNATVKMTQIFYSIFELKRKFEAGNRQDIIINPEFQREKVWTKNKQKSELIESILMGIPLPIIYLFERNDGKKEVVDGRQRITTLVDFLDNKFSLSNLRLLSKLNGKNFKDLDPFLQTKIEDYQITTYTIQPPTPDRVKFDIFDRVNRGGTQLNNQEMRNALYPGYATKLLKELSELDIFKKATGKSIPSIRMKDKYIILRFIGFYLLQTSKLVTQTTEGIIKKVEYKSDIDEFLASTMRYLNSSENYKNILYLKDIFIKSMTLSYELFKGDGFRFNDISKNKRPINTPLFESLAYLYTIVGDDIDLKSFKEDVENLKTEFDKTTYFRSSVESTNTMNMRFDTVKELGQRYVK